MPLERLGKLRESLTVSSEQYKKEFLRYLEARSYTVKASSDVEAIFADAILTRKNEKRDYWLEVKQTEVSLEDSDFLRQLAKYLAAYLSRTPENRFRMILACDRIVNAPLFKQVYDQLDSKTIIDLVAKMVKLSDPSTQRTIQSASPEDIKRFFEDTDVKEADLKFLLSATEKIKPTPPSKPTLPEVEYAAKVTEAFGDVSPIKSTDKIFLNIFELEVPAKIYWAATSYKTSKDIFAEKPKVSFPAFDLNNGQIVTFEKFTKGNPLSDFIDLNSINEEELYRFIERNKDESIVIKILNRWIKGHCRNLGLVFDDRTKAYYYPKSTSADGSINKTWRAPIKESTRELTKPMISGDKVNFWVHQSAIISAKDFWSKFFIQIKPRFLFSPDGTNLYDGPKADKLDRNFRKSKFSHNLNQLYSVLFWYRHVFPETENLTSERLDVCLGFNFKQSIRILSQVTVDAECKPNTEPTEDLAALEKIDIDITNLETLDPYFGE